MSAEKSSSGIFEKLTPFLLVASIALAFGVGVLWQKVNNLEKGTTTKATPDTTQQQPAAVAVTKDQIKDVFNKGVVQFGDTNGKLLIIEASDPSCPYCDIATGLNGELNKQASTAQIDFTLVEDGGTYVAPIPEIRKLVDQGKAAYAYVYTPGHGSGEMGMKALYCAFDVGKFWQVHDLLMSAKGYDLLNDVVKNDTTKSQTLVDFLKSVTDPTQLKTCIDSGKYDQRLQDDTSLASSLGVQGTPGFFINEQTFRGAYSFDDMKPAIDAALK